MDSGVPHPQKCQSLKSTGHTNFGKSYKNKTIDTILQKSFDILAKKIKWKYFACIIPQILVKIFNDCSNCHGGQSAIKLVKLIKYLWERIALRFRLFDRGIYLSFREGSDELFEGLIMILCVSDDWCINSIIDNQKLVFDRFLPVDSFSGLPGY